MFSEIRKVQDNWDEYRCQPSVMPFAGLFGKNAGENFTYCLGNSQKDLMGYFLTPINQTFGLFAKLGGGLLKDMQQMREVMDWLRNMSNKMGFDIVGIIIGLVKIAVMTINKIVDTIRKIVTIIVALVYLLQSVVLWSQSFWDSIPEPFCFHPKTKVTLKNGSTVYMKDLNLGDEILNGGSVLGVLKLKNAHKEPYYKIFDTNLTDYIYVTGMHKIKNKDRLIFVKDYTNAEKTSIVGDELSCLITSNHTIEIGNHVFVDWEQIEYC
jgi:hypothetical protein